MYMLVTVRILHTKRNKKTVEHKSVHRGGEIFFCVLVLFWEREWVLFDDDGAASYFGVLHFFFFFGLKR